MRGDGRVYLRGKIWWIEYWCNGTGHRESTHSQEENAARRALRERQSHRDAGEFSTAAGPRRFLEQILEHYKTAHSAEIGRGVSATLYTLQKHFHACRLADLTDSVLEQYVTARRRTGISWPRIQRELTILRSVLVQSNLPLIPETVKVFAALRHLIETMKAHRQIDVDPAPLRDAGEMHKQGYAQLILQRAVSVQCLCGVYFLLANSAIMYVGQSHDIFQRISQHRADGKAFDAYAYLEFPEEDLDVQETWFITLFCPPWNMRGLPLTAKEIGG